MVAVYSHRAFRFLGFHVLVFLGYCVNQYLGYRVMRSLGYFAGIVPPAASVDSEGVFEVVSDFEANTFRAVYALRLERANRQPADSR
jgi:hypothetical protein